jgi:NADH:ubiquinone oxidoreductase subunit K
MSILYIFRVFFFIASIICFFLQRKTILSALLRLEAMILSCLFQTFFLPERASSLAVFILIIAACERAFGLTILVVISRSEETDKLFFLTS